MKDTKMNDSTKKLVGVFLGLEIMRKVGSMFAEAIEQAQKLEEEIKTVELTKSNTQEDK